MSGGYRSGFVSLIGCPNAGKSTLLNRFVGQKVAIVSDRAQTTRNRVLGVLTREGSQIVFLDTPGMTTPKNRLGEYMQKVATEALSDVEAVLFVSDAQQGVRERDERILERLARVKAPLFALVNKCDAAPEGAAQQARAALCGRGLFRAVFCGSAKTGEGLDALEAALLAAMPEGPQYFPDDMVTDQPERVICAEMVREKALESLREEVPHGVGVAVERMAMREGGGLMDVFATVYCERESHKGILIGRGGAMLRRIGTAARADMERMLGCRVNLQLHVKVKEDWRNRQGVLHELGYE